MNLRQKIAILAVPAVLAIAGGAVVVHGATPPAPVPAGTQDSAVEDSQATGADPAGDQGQQGTADQAGDQSSQAGDQGQTGELDQANETK